MTKDRRLVEAYVAQANPSVLRMALYQATRDLELVDMKINHVIIRGGAFYTYLVDDAHAETIRRKAIEFLLSDASKGAFDLPNDAELRHMMEMMTGRSMRDSEFRFGREELALEEFPREATWTHPGTAVPEGFRVVIVGAGASGIAAAIQFERLGIPYVVYERQPDLGGTWNLNRYPDARVDTSSFLYQYKFVKNYPWREFFASQPEVKAYLEHVARRYNVYDRIVFDTELVRAAYQESEQTWAMTLRGPGGEQSEVTTNVIISAAGQFSTPKAPDIEGVDGFTGPLFHTAAWLDGYGVAGQRIAVIGNGSTGVQVMPKIAEDAGQVYAFQRTPQWISPMERYREAVGDDIRWMFDNMPFYWNWYCYHTQVMTSEMQLAQEYDREWQSAGGIISERNDGLRENLTAYIKQKVGHRPDLVDKLVPDYAPLARRLIVDNGWYDALLRDNVELVTEGIERFTPSGIRTADGVERAVDAVVFAGGFEATHYLYPVEYVGLDGLRLEDFWAKDGPRAYAGIAVPGFPNLFIHYGPNSQTRSGAFISWSEVWARYAAQGVIHLIENGYRSLTVKEPVFEDYNTELDRESRGLIWEYEGPVGHNYYVNQHGRQNVNYPWRNEDYFEYVERFDPTVYDFD